MKIRFTACCMVEFEVKAKNAREAEIIAHNTIKNCGATILHTSIEKSDKNNINIDLCGNDFYGR